MHALREKTQMLSAFRTFPTVVIGKTSFARKKPFRFQRVRNTRLYESQWRRRQRYRQTRIVNKNSRRELWMKSFVWRHSESHANEFEQLPYSVDTHSRIARQTDSASAFSMTLKLLIQWHTHSPSHSLSLSHSLCLCETMTNAIEILPKKFQLCRPTGCCCFCCCCLR